MRARACALVAVCCLLVLVSCSEDNPAGPSCPTLAPVTDLQVREATLMSITLGWTTPVAQGENLAYDVRYLEASAMGGGAQLTEALWDVAHQAPGEPPVSHAGADASLEILGLVSDVEYFAAIRIVSLADTTLSDISNTARGWTQVFLIESSAPYLPLPDSDPTGVTDVIMFPRQLEIVDLLVGVNITHTWIGDLIVELTSPDGTVVRLHNRTGSSADNIIGTYDTTLTVDGPGSLTDFDGGLTQGAWTLWVSDNAGLDLGVVNEWAIAVRGSAP